MGKISKSGITPHAQIKSEHITRVIDALTGVSTSVQIEVSGSITASYFRGDGSGLTGITSSLGNITGSNTYIPIFSGSSKLINSSITEDATSITFNGSSNSFVWNKTLPFVGGWYRGQSSIEINIGNPQSAQFTGFDFKGTGVKGYIYSFHTLDLGANSTSSLTFSGSYTTVNNILVLPPTGTLPSGVATGSILSSGSGANCKPYFYNGSTWTPFF